jgi:hypothetical protein
MTPKLYGLVISWMVPFDDGGSPITGYRIYRGESRSNMEFHVDVSSYAIEYQDTGLTAGKEYHYQISALNEFHEGERSWFITGFGWGLPSAPTDLITMPGDGEVDLAWGPPEDDGGLPVLGYIIVRGTDPDTLPQLASVGVVTSYIDDTAENGVTYYYAIAAINEAGPGDFTDPILIAPFKPATAPDKVTTLVADVKGTGVTLQWTAPQEDGGSPITGYVILRGLAKDSLKKVVEVGPDITTWSEDGLERGTTYYYSVSAKNEVGEGEPILAREVKVPKEKEEGPGFGTGLMVIASLIVLVWTRIERGRRLT